MGSGQGKLSVKITSYSIWMAVLLASCICFCSYIQTLVSKVEQLHSSQGIKYETCSFSWFVLMNVYLFVFTISGLALTW